MSFVSTIIGQAPGKTPGPVLGGKCGARLASLAGLGSYEELARKHTLVNLLKTYPGASSAKGDGFPMARAKRAARGMLPSLRSCVLLLGRAVGRAFGGGLIPVFDGSNEYFHRTFTQRAMFVVVPHPSGLNRWWNDPKNVRRAEAFLREALK